MNKTIVLFLIMQNGFALGLSNADQQKAIDLTYQRFSEYFPILHQDDLCSDLKNISDDLKKMIKERFLPRIINNLKQNEISCIKKAIPLVEIMVLRSSVGFTTDKMYNKCLEYESKKVSSEKAITIISNIMNRVIFDFYQSPPVFSLEKVLIHADDLIKNEYKKDVCKTWNKCREDICLRHARL